MSSMIETIEKRLRELIPLRDDPLFEAVRYSLFSSGKRIRPLLVLATAATFGVNPLIALDVASAIEMIHTYSLIHDDLPCMDNDDFRRGKPTLHKIYGEALALLAGDYLLTRAFEVIANGEALGREQRIQMIKSVASRAGAPGMIGGQAMELDSEGIDEESLLQIHAGKTGSLFTTCLECGMLAAGYPPTPLIQSIGYELGLAYQFQDDLMDVGNEEGKTTAVSLFGPALTQEKLLKLQTSLLEKVKTLPQNGGELLPLLQKILS